MKRAEEKQLVKNLFKLWEKLCETGEIHIGKGFVETYDKLKKQVEEFGLICECKRPLIRTDISGGEYCGSCGYDIKK